MLCSIIHQSQKVPIFFLTGCIGAWHKDKLFTEATAAWKPSLCLPCVCIHPGESLQIGHIRLYTHAKMMPIGCFLSVLLS